MLDKIKQAHSKVKSGADFPAYIQDLIEMGISGYSTFVSDGHTVYNSTSGEQFISASKYETLAIAEKSDGAVFIQQLKLHQQRYTNYPEFCKDAASNGVEKWVVDTAAMTCIYFDLAGKNLLQESIPSGK